MIRAIYDIAIAEKKSGNSSFDIILHMHDGVTMRLCGNEESKQAVIKRIEKAVKKKARQHGIQVNITE